MKIIKIATLANDFVVIYRAVPAGVTEFRNMDYVTKSRKWAIEHAEHVSGMDEEDAIVLRAMVRSSDIEDAYNPGEYRYVGSGVKGEEVHRVTPEIY